MNCCGGEKAEVTLPNMIFHGIKILGRTFVIFLPFKLLDFDPFAMTILNRVCALDLCANCLLLQYNVFIKYITCMSAGW